ncbi:MAG: hypothetical protein KTR31_32435 [Myxococcales bacterium]|nr:hypothetical protein [Myxococcales bacterium]
MRIRSLVGLLAKEVQQHVLPLSAAGAMVLCTVIIQWMTVVAQGQPTLLAAASGVAFYVMPMYAVFAAERLVVLDRSAGTHEFLAALPLSVTLRYVVQLAVGWAATVVTVTAVVLLTAVAATQREGVPLLFVGQLLAQTWTYVTAWFALAFGIAHLGRFRWLTWWLLLTAFLMGEPVLSDDPFRVIGWHGVLLDPVDQARAVPPWSSLPLALAWTVFGVGLGWGLVRWRAGVWVERLFRPGNSREFGYQIMLAIGVPMVLELLIDERPRDGWASLSVVGDDAVEIRVAGSPGSDLWRIGRDAAADLALLGQRTGVEEFGPIVLVRGRQERLRPVHHAPAAYLDRSLVLVVDLQAHHADLVREVVYRALLQRTGSGGWDADVDWLLRGTPGWLRPDPVLARRAAAGAAALPHMGDWLQMELAVGEDVAEGVAWAGVQALDDETVTTLLSAVLAPRVDRVTYFTDLAMHRIDTPAITSLWTDALQAHVRGVSEATVTLPPLVLDGDDGAVRARWSSKPPQGTQLRWRQLDPLSAHPAPGDPNDVESLDEDSWSLVIPVDPSRRVAAELVVFDPSIRGLRTTGWSSRW